MTHDIGPSFVPRVKPSVATVELDGERVVYDLDTWRLHKLDRLASLVWECFDGAADVAELSADIAEAFDTDVHQVRADVLELVRSLADEDLLVVDHGGAVLDGETNSNGPEVPHGPEVPDGPTYLVDPPGG